MNELALDTGCGNCFLIENIYLVRFFFSATVKLLRAAGAYTVQQKLFYILFKCEFY